jgi:hypothetical protein
MIFGDRFRKAFSSRFARTVGWIILLGWLTFLSSVLSELAVMNPQKFLGMVALISGILVIVIPKFYEKVKDGELNLFDFNPWYLVRALPVFQLLWEFVLRTSIVQPGETLLQTMSALFMLGLASEEGIQIIWRLIKIGLGEEESRT